MNAKPRAFSPEKLQEIAENHKDEELAMAAGVTARTIANWRAGRGEPDATALAALAAVTGKPLDFFFERVA